MNSIEIMVNMHYSDYLSKKLNDISFVSDAEIDAANILAKHPDIDNFLMIVFSTDNYLLYHCSVNIVDGIKCFHVSGIDEHKIDLCNFLTTNNYMEETINQYNMAFYQNDDHKYIYDNMYDELSPDLKCFNDGIRNIVKSMHVNNVGNIFVKGKYVNIKSLLYFIQEVNGSIVDLIPCGGYSDIDKRIFIPIDIMKTQLQICDHSIWGTIKNLLFLDFIKTGLTVMIPHSSKTLLSKFAFNATWGDILPLNEDGDCVIGNCKMSKVSISFVIDGYSNVFCVAYDMNNNRKVTLIRNAFDVIAS